MELDLLYLCCNNEIQHKDAYFVISYKINLYLSNFPTFTSNPFKFHYKHTLTLF